MNHCRDCRYWGDEESWGPGHRWHEKGAHDCKHPALKAIPYGEGVEMEGISTLPDFGCVQYEERLDDH